LKLTLAQAARCMGASGDFDAKAVAAGYSIDSRTLAPGELFFAVRGERLDGHNFVDHALRKGAVAAVVSRQLRPRFPANARLLVVDDTLAALQALGSAARRLWGRTLVAVTGSTG